MQVQHQDAGFEPVPQLSGRCSAQTPAADAILPARCAPSPADSATLLAFGEDPAEQREAAGRQPSATACLRPSSSPAPAAVADREQMRLPEDLAVAKSASYARAREILSSVSAPVYLLAKNPDQD